MHRNKFGQAYYTLVGGSLQPNEPPEQAALREAYEETTLVLAQPKLVFVEESGVPYGTQYIYLCIYRGGEVTLPQQSVEAKIHAMGKNLYEPMWLPVKDLPDVTFLSEGLKRHIIDGLLHGFPQQPITFNS